MLQTLLTIMLFIMPFLLSQKEISHPGLHTGLWISLFFWGRIHAMFSIIIFGVSVIFYAIQTKGSSPKQTSFSATWIPRSGSRPLTGFLAVLMIFCAFGNVCRDYGAALELSPIVQQSAIVLGFAGSLSGPVVFGIFSDRNGPFSAFMMLLFIGLAGVGFTALSVDHPDCFPIGSLLIQSVIGGVFTLMPQLLLRFYGRPQLSYVLPFLLLFLSGLWAAALGFYTGADALPQDYLLSMVFLLVMAAPLAVHSWKRRFTVL